MVEQWTSDSRGWWNSGTVIVKGGNSGTVIVQGGGTVIVKGGGTVEQ